MKNIPRDSILDYVGNTPLTKLHKIPKDHGVKCEIYVKCEFLNPCGSIKDRIALGMIREAKEKNLIHEYTKLVEPTSGNTGIGIAFNCALTGNKCTIVTEQKNSSEKINTIRLLGAEVIQVKNNEEELKLAHKLQDEYPNYFMLNQFDNHANPKIHYDGTGTEIVNALDNIDMIVLGAGTGGTMTGVGVKVKEHYPDCKIVAAEPAGSIMINEDGKAHDFLVEGIGGTWVPTVLDKSIVDEMEVANDKESFLMARELARKEGLLCGGSSGTAMVCAIKAINRLSIGSGKKVVVILPDGIRNYMTKFVSDQWMESKFFMDPPEHTMRWWHFPITALKLNHNYPVIQKNYTCSEALNEMKDIHKYAVVVNEHRWFLGVISKDSLRNSATNPTKLPEQSSEEFNFNDLVTEHLANPVYTLPKNGRKGMPTLGRLSRILDITPFVVIGTLCHDHEHFIADGIATGDDVLDYIYANPK